MFLSRVPLDTTKHEVRRALSSPQRLHAALENCFKNDVEKYRTLWRIDSLNDHLYILILSKYRPDFSNFEAQFCSDKGQSKEYAPFLNSIQNGQTVKFRLRANPTQSKSLPNQRGKVFPLLSNEGRKEWLLKRAENNGFSLESDYFEVIEVIPQRFYRKQNEKPVLITSVTYEGQLTIIDILKFKNLLVNGIGRGKAYGCGLMTVIPINH